MYWWSHWTLRGVAGTRPGKLPWQRDRSALHVCKGARHMTVSHTFKVCADGPSRTAEKISKTQNHVLGVAAAWRQRELRQKKTGSKFLELRFAVRAACCAVACAAGCTAKLAVQLAGSKARLLKLALSLALPRRLEATKSISSGKCIPRIKPKFSAGNDCSEFRGINSLANCFEFKRVKRPSRRPSTGFSSAENTIIIVLTLPPSTP